MNVLDPATPFPYLLYTLAGAGVVAFSIPHNLKHLDQVQRDVYAAHPPLRALLALVLWAIWPLVAALLVVEGIATVALYLIDLFDDDEEDE